eukprot:scaffold145207_cov22-Tisochrysis_lutea.AAC.1
MRPPDTEARSAYPLPLAAGPTARPLPRAPLAAAGRSAPSAPSSLSVLSMQAPESALMGRADRAPRITLATRRPSATSTAFGAAGAGKLGVLLRGACPPLTSGGPGSVRAGLVPPVRPASPSSLAVEPWARWRDRRALAQASCGVCRSPSDRARRERLASQREVWEREERREREEQWREAFLPPASRQRALLPCLLLGPA